MKQIHGNKRIGTTRPITLSFVIPVYNETARLAKTFKALQQCSIPNGIILESIIFVNDGSRDLSFDLLTQFKQWYKKSIHYKKYGSKIKIISYSRNRGKGYAVRTGMMESTADYTLFFDADISTPLSELSKFVIHMKQGVPVIVGTRKNGHSTVIKHQPLYRELLGKGFTFITKLALNTWITDFTCGFKAFSQFSNKDIFASSAINGWAYDAEILFLARKKQYQMVEVPVKWSHDPKTKVNLIQAIPNTLQELARIQYIHNIKPFINTFKGISIRITLKRSIAPTK